MRAWLSSLLRFSVIALEVARQPRQARERRERERERNHRYQARRGVACLEGRSEALLPISPLPRSPLLSLLRAPLFLLEILLLLLFLPGKFRAHNTFPDDGAETNERTNQRTNERREVCFLHAALELDFLFSHRAPAPHSIGPFP